MCVLLSACVTITNMSKNFSYDEFVYSETALIAGIDNTPNNTHIQNGKLLFENVMQPIRDKFGKVIVTSAYRNPHLNKMVGGIEDSQHVSGQAVDFVVRSTNHKKVCQWIIDNLEFDQLILEPSWIHVSYSNDVNRNEVLTYHNGMFIPGLL